MRAFAILSLVVVLSAPGALAQDCRYRLEFIGWPGHSGPAGALDLQDFAGGPVIVSEEHVQSAQSILDHNNAPALAFEFTPEGAALFGAHTTQNIGQPIAIVVNGALVSAPVVQTPILGGQGIITGNFTVQETNEMAEALVADTCQPKLGS